MKTILLAAAFGATALTSVANAGQTTPTPPAAPMQRMDADRDGTMTRAEAIAMADAMFARIDANGDGTIEKAERQAMKEARADRREARGKGPRAGRGMRDPMMPRPDADRDGNVTLAEHRAVAVARFDLVDTNRDGSVDPAERAAMKEQRMARRGAMPTPPEAPDQ